MSCEFIFSYNAKESRCYDNLFSLYSQLKKNCFYCSKNIRIVFVLIKNANLQYSNSIFLNIDKTMTKFEKKIKNRNCLRNCERIDSFRRQKVFFF